MTKFALLCTSLAAMLVGLLAPTPAQAISKTFVSSTGDDANPCTLAAPCSTILAALNATTSGGTLSCLDSSDFSSGSVTITKTITIDCRGTTAQAGPFNINGANITVTIRGLIITSIGSGAIVFQNGSLLTVENCIIWQNGIGIQFGPTAAGSQLSVVDTIIRKNGGSGIQSGIYVKPSAGIQTNITIARTLVEKNFFGIIADGTGGGSIRGVVRDSLVSGNANNGITATSSGAGAAVLSVENTSVSGNNFGLVAAGASSGMLVGQSSIVLNNTGLFTTGGALLLSYRNNNVNGNTTTDGAFTGVIAQQ